MSANTTRDARRPIPGALGILGGTFDPIHLGHLAIAEAVREALRLERILFVPTGVPVHKPGRPISPAPDRVAMVGAAIADNPAFALSRAEVDRPGPSFAVDTLEALTAQARAAGHEPDLIFILSAEAYAALPAWRRPERILELCRMAVVPRPGAASVDLAAMDRRLPGASARTVLVDAPLLDISGSAIRARVAAGRSIRYLVPDAVIAYIGDHGLYAAPEADRPQRTPTP
jgi:nicotinate-nucleotide adenylyltransferase